MGGESPALAVAAEKAEAGAEGDECDHYDGKGALDLVLLILALLRPARRFRAVRVGKSAIFVVLHTILRNLLPIDKIRFLSGIHDLHRLLLLLPLTLILVLLWLLFLRLLLIISFIPFFLIIISFTSIFLFFRFILSCLLIFSSRIRWFLLNRLRLLLPLLIIISSNRIHRFCLFSSACIILIRFDLPIIVPIVPINVPFISRRIFSLFLLCFIIFFYRRILCDFFRFFGFSRLGVGRMLSALRPYLSACLVPLFI